MHRRKAPLRRHRHAGSPLIEEAVIALLLGGRPHRPERRMHAPIRPARGLLPPSGEEREAWARFHSAMAAGG